MGSYRLRLREIRLSEREVADDVALFEVTQAYVVGGSVPDSSFQGVAFAFAGFG
jgi:hypothetical protein